MRFLNYAIVADIKGEGNTGKRLNSLIRVKLGIEDETGGERSMEIGPDFVQFFCDTYKIDHVRSGRDFEKYFQIKDEMRDGGVVVTVKNISKYCINLTREGWCTEAKQEK